MQLVNVEDSTVNGELVAKIAPPPRFPKERVNVEPEIVAVLSEKIIAPPAVEVAEQPVKFEEAIMTVLLMSCRYTAPPEDAVQPVKPDPEIVAFRLFMEYIAAPLSYPEQLTNSEPVTERVSPPPVFIAPPLYAEQLKNRDDVTVTVLPEPADTAPPPAVPATIPFLSVRPSIVSEYPPLLLKILHESRALIIVSPKPWPADAFIVVLLESPISELMK